MRSTTRYFTFFILSLQLFTSCATGQDTGSHFLKPGDKMPDVSFKIHNYKTPAAKISDFKGKAVIIDLWGVYCGSCIAAMPYMQELQKQFADDLQIIMATRDNETKVAKLALRSDNVKNNIVPSVMDDTLAYMFDYQWLPTEVWIDKNGVVKYISTGEALSKENIKRFIAGENIELNEKLDLDIDRESPLLVSWYPYYKSIGIYSYLTPAQKIYTAGNMYHWLQIDKNKKHYRMSFDIISSAGLYKVAYGFGRKYQTFSDSRIIFNRTKNSHSTLDMLNDSYTYDLITSSDVSPDRIYKYMVQQLDLYFNFNSKLVKKEIPCFILTKSGDNAHSYLTKGGHVKGDKSLGIYKIQNVSWAIAIANIENKFYSPLQVLDETGIAPQAKVDITFNLNHWNNLPLLNKELAPYGLKVTKEKRMLDCIVIEEVD